MIKKISIIGCLSLVLFSCKKDKPAEEEKVTVTPNNGFNVFVTNEGAFMAGTATITKLEASTGIITDDIYKASNNNLPLGDVCQSMTELGSNFYLVVNNSQKVVRVDKSTFVKNGEITGLTSPRFLLPISNTKAYVSDLYANAISIVNLSNNTKTGSIHINGWTEEMIIADGKVFVCNEYTNYVYVINPNTDALLDSIAVGYGSNSIRQDINGKLWVLCSGDGIGIPGHLARINPITHSIEQNLTFSNVSQSPSKLTMNGNDDELYFINNNVYKMSISDVNLPNTAIINANGKNFYSLSVEPINSTIYVGDAKDFSQRGYVYRYNTNLTQIDSFKVGVNPGGIYFSN